MFWDSGLWRILGADKGIELIICTKCAAGICIDAAKGHKPHKVVGKDSCFPIHRFRTEERRTALSRVVDAVRKKLGKVYGRGGRFIIAAGSLAVRRPHAVPPSMGLR